MNTNSYRIFEVKWQTIMNGYFHGIVKVNDDDKEKNECKILHRFPDSDAWKNNDTIAIVSSNIIKDDRYIAIEYTKEKYPEYFI